MKTPSTLTDADYRNLLQFRVALRRFLNWSGAQAEEQGITSTQHLLLLAVRGHPGERGPTISDVAELLDLKHHSAVELADRCETAGLVQRIVDPEDQRRVRLKMTSQGAKCLDAISRSNIGELNNLAAMLQQLTQTLDSMIEHQ